MTPKVFFREVKAAELRSEDRLREGTTQAWQTVRIYAEAKGRKFPPLKRLLEEIGGKASGRGGEQSLVEMKAALQMIAAQNRLKMRKVAV